MSKIKGYKVFNSDWTCKGFQYEVGKSYEMEKEPIACKQGFHFCEKLEDCYSCYNFDKNNKVAEITAYGDISVTKEGQKSCTNKIKIERELSWKEVLAIVNIGDCNDGFGNSGFGNTGHFNTGHFNTGHYNRGCSNSGFENSGSYNHGFNNNGDYNSGNYNSGNYNIGDCNNGDWNKTDFSSGCFNTVKQKIFLFNKISDWTLKDWKCSIAKEILDSLAVEPTQKVYEENMTDNEKEAHPEYQITGFYLKELTQKEMAKKNQKNWNKLSQKEKDIVMAIPNFDKSIFKEITGIDVDK